MHAPPETAAEEITVVPEQAVDRLRNRRRRRYLHQQQRY